MGRRTFDLDSAVMVPKGYVSRFLVFLCEYKCHDRSNEEKNVDDRFFLYVVINVGKERYVMHQQLAVVPHAANSIPPRAEIKLAL